jgi:WD40 repeat protein
MAAGNARTTQLWDAAAGQQVAELEIDLEEVFTSIVSWSGDGQRLALGTLNAAQVWDVSCATKPVKLQSCCFPSSRASYLYSALDPTGRMLAVACGQQLAICHISSGAVPQPDTPVPPGVQVVCVLGDLAERGSEVQAVR